MFLIRQAHSTDIEQILHIWLEASIQAHHFIPIHFWQEQLDNMHDVYLPLAENYVIVSKCNILGFASLLKTDISTEYCLAALFIAPAFQGQGFGSKLLKFTQQQSTALDLQVYTENTTAVQFYHHHGFQIVKASVDEYTQHAQLDLRWTMQ